MKVAFVIYPGACLVGEGDGQRMQALTWKEALHTQDIEVELVNPWKGYDWKRYDVIHVFGFGLWNYDFIHWGSRINPNFVFSPIIDSNTPMWKYRLATYCGSSRLRLYSRNQMLRVLRKDIKLFLARSEYEAEYLHKGYGIGNEKIARVPLSYRFDNYTGISKKEFCLFAGTMTQERKNVATLIKAALKYDFPLVLVGNTGNRDTLRRLESLAGDSGRIQIKGFVTDNELKKLYNQARVFALPSLNEGVGLVALEAAVHGCNIVITRTGGPKEYYGDLAYTVDPRNMDDIGIAIKKALADRNKQPQLREHIIKNYSPEVCVRKLTDAYQRIFEKQYAK